MKIITMVWGARHADYMARAAIPSWLTPGNIDVASAAKVECYTEDTFIDADLDVTYFPLPQVSGPGRIAQACLVDALKRNVGETLIIAPPDTVWADGAMVRLLESGMMSGTVVGFPHARVIDDAFINYISARAHRLWSDPESMVRNAGLCLHPSFGDAIGGRNSYMSGVVLRPVEGGYIVHHRLPTPYMVNVMPGDGEALERCGKDQGGWDHVWPSTLFEQDRWRVVGSSDLCFAVELTPADVNIPPCAPGPRPGQLDDYIGWREHHKVNRCFISFWRGE